MSPLKHQEEDVKKALKVGGDFGFFWEPGLGKTYATLHLFEEMKKKKDVRMLVICPISLIKNTWMKDTEKFTDFEAMPFKKIKREKPEIMLINFESLIREKNAEQVYSMIRRERIFCVVDESSKMKNHQSKIAKILLYMQKHFCNRSVLSGTPDPNGKLELWPQVNFVKPNLLLKNFYQFRNSYFNLQRNNEIIQGKIYSREQMQQLFKKGFKYQIEPNAEAQILRRMDPYFSWRKKVDCLDLPEVLPPVIRSVQLSANEKKAYKQMAHELYLELKGGEVMVQHALSKMMKLRQITSGFIYDAEHESYRIGKSKLAELQQFIDQIGDEQLIIWIQFEQEVCHILELLKDKSVVTLYGGTKNRDKSIEDFTDKKAQFLIAHPRSAAHGLTFINCSMQLFYSIDYSFEAHEQARGRTDRHGQTKRCLYVYLLAEGTIDEIIYNALINKADLKETTFKIIKSLK